MDKYCTAVAGDARAGVVIDFDDQIVEPVGAFKPVAWFIGRPPEWPVVATVLGIFAPGLFWRDRPDRQQGAWSWQAVRSPPQPNRMKSPCRRAAIAFAFRGFDAGAAQRGTQGALPCQEPRLPAKGMRADMNMNRGQRGLVRYIMLSSRDVLWSRQSALVPP